MPLSPDKQIIHNSIINDFDMSSYEEHVKKVSNELVCKIDELIDKAETNKPFLKLSFLYEGKINLDIVQLIQNTYKNAGWKQASVRYFHDHNHSTITNCIYNVAVKLFR